MSHVLAENYTVDGMAACQLHNIRCILQGSALGGRCTLRDTVHRTPLEGLEGDCPCREVRGTDRGGVGDDFGRRGIDSPSDRRYLL